MGGLLMKRWGRSGGISAAASDKVSSITVFPGSTFTISSSSYIDVLDGSGGAPVSVSITKSAGTSLLVMASMSMGISSGTPTMGLGVKDGTTDYDMARVRVDAPGFNQSRQAVGSRLIAGLAAGTYTFTLRAKSTTSSGGYGLSHSATLTLMEVT